MNWKEIEWGDAPFQSLEQARELLGPGSRYYKRWLRGFGEDVEWIRYFTIIDEDDHHLRHVIAQRETMVGPQGPVKMAEVIRKVLSPEHRCMQVGRRYAGDWHNNPDWHGEPDPEKFELVAAGKYRAYRLKDGSIHEVLYREDGHLFKRVLCPPVN